MAISGSPRDVFCALLIVFGERIEVPFNLTLLVSFSATDDGVCEPVCDSPCVRGTCVEPETCSCDPGFSGPTCSEVGCKDGNWGPDCANPCPCLENGRCEPNTGKCICLPGWEGLHCTRRYISHLTGL